MSRGLVFYTNPFSRAAIVHWMLEEIGEPFRVELIPFGPAMRSAEFLAINPMGKVPALVHGETVVTEAAAICAYLADAFPEAGLAPKLGDRAEYYRWLFFAAGCLEPAISNHSMGWDPSEEEYRRFGYGSFDAVLDTIEGAVARGPYLAGDQFTAADLYLAKQLSFGMGFGLVPKRAAFTAYVEPLLKRPAALRAEEQGQALAAQLGG